MQLIILCHRQILSSNKNYIVLFIKLQEVKNSSEKFLLILTLSEYLQSILGSILWLLIKIVKIKINK